MSALIGPAAGASGGQLDAGLALPEAEKGGGHPLEEASEVMVAETCGLKARHAARNTLSSTNAAFQTAL